MKLYRPLIPALVVSLGVVTLAFSASAAATPSSSPTPIGNLPAPPSVDYDSLTPGVMTLIAVLPRGDTAWIKPTAGSPITLTSPSSTTGAAAQPAGMSGCEAVDQVPAFTGNDLQGSVDWSACYNVFETIDNVGMQKSGSAASFFKENVHYGNADWTAWSQPYGNCKFQLNQWRTVDNSEIEDVYGNEGFFAGASGYVGRYC